MFIYTYIYIYIYIHIVMNFMYTNTCMNTFICIGVRRAAGVAMYTFTHKFYVHILQEHTVDTDRCVCLYASAPARHSDSRCIAHVIAFVSTANNRRHVCDPSCRTHRGSALTTCRSPDSFHTRPSCRTNLMFDAVHSTQVHLPVTIRQRPARRRSATELRMFQQRASQTHSYPEEPAVD